MGMFDFLPTQDSLNDLLERERHAIIEARFDQLERIAKEKERLVGLLQKSDINVEKLAQLRQKIERNGKLLQAMQLGLENARSLIQSLGKPKPALQTYDQLGMKHVHSTGDSETGHRA